MSQHQPEDLPTFAEVEDAVRASLRQLREQDFVLLENDVSERAITHKLAEYLQMRFYGRNVDCEYNRNLPDGPRAQKSIDILKSRRRGELAKVTNEDERQSCSTYPDIIVHTRTVNEGNLLVVEVKKRNSSQGHDFDHLKLEAFTMNEGTDEDGAVSTDPKRNRYDYKFGVFILLDTGNPDPAEPVLTWFAGGNQVPPPVRM